MASRLSQSTSPDHDVEIGEKYNGRDTSSKISHWRMVTDQGVVTPEIINWHYEGSGTGKDPYAVVWMENDPRNPMEFDPVYRWALVLTMALSVLAVSLASSMYGGALSTLLPQYRASTEIGLLGLSLFVLGFALGPLFWAPFSEMFGRQIVYIGTFGAFVIFEAATCASQNMATIIVLRFLAGSFGSSPLTNAGGVIADCFPARHRGLATACFASAPFLGPALGPVIGGFLGQAAGWRWVMGFMAALAGVAWIAGTTVVPETYAPVLLRRRAERLSKMTGKVYKSKLDIERGKVTLGKAIKTALTRPWILLLREPIVSIMSVYMAIVYGTLYMLFAAYPIVYAQSRGWSQGISGLAFIGVLIGMMAAVLYSIFIENPRYQKVTDEAGGVAPPEARLPPAILGGCLLPIGLFWFAWTNSPSLPWAASMAAGIPFGAGMVLVFLSIMNYLIDSYTIFAASVLAANAVIRSLFGAAFPLFTTQMYGRLGIHWASTIPAFLALACVPFPFLFYKYGAAIRARCKFAAEADAFMKRMRGEIPDDEPEDEIMEAENERREEEEEREENLEKSKEHGEGESSAPGFERIKTSQSARDRVGGRGSALRTVDSRGRPVDWDDNPYTMDRVNTRESFRGSRSRGQSQSRA